MSNGETYLVLGGGGMIGRRLVHEICCELKPRWVIICSLYQKEVREAIEHFRREFPYIKFIGSWGDVFLRAEWNDDQRQGRLNRLQMLSSPEYREALHEDLFGDFDEAYKRSRLVQLILEHKPEVVVDSINTATSISYQDIYAASENTKARYENLMREMESGGDAVEVDPETRRAQLLQLAGGTEEALEKLLISQSVPQLIRDVLLISRAMSEAGTRIYLKVGTTGTGGMGLNIPYTHSEDKPSVTLMTKTAIAFAHTGLMFLMARTPGGPIVKEIKPGAMVGFANITHRAITARGKPVYLFQDQVEKLDRRLTLRQPEKDYERLDKLRMVIVDTGENGLFTGGEFETITHLWQMEYITPEEIARQGVLEIKGSNTGRDVIAAIDGAVMNPTYRAGYLRHLALEDVARLEDGAKSHSVALGYLGPPELGKLLWEGYLLKLRYHTISAVLEEDDDEIASEMTSLLQSDSRLRQTIVSVGLPILISDGSALIRGPSIRIPESPNRPVVELTDANLENWAGKGWVDLRPKNVRVWRERFLQMRREAHRRRDQGSAAYTRQAYLSDEIYIGQIVAWVLNNEDLGYRVK